jgi:50S ribosomal protein uL30
MIAIIRITGQVGLDRDVVETFNRLNLPRKYSCIVLTNPTEERLGMLKKLYSFVAYGEISKETFSQLMEKRAKLIDKTKKTDLVKVQEELIKGKKFQDSNLKPFFSLHPPRGGIKAKVHFPKGVLGDNKEKINDLILRML